MPPGSYIIKIGSLDTEYILVIYAGTPKLYERIDNDQKGAFLRYLHASEMEMIKIIRKVKSEQKLYNIGYFVNNKLNRTIALHVQYPMAVLKIKELKRMKEYQGGTLKPIECKY